MNAPNLGNGPPPKNNTTIAMRNPKGERVIVNAWDRDVLLKEGYTDDGQDGSFRTWLGRPDGPPHNVEAAPIAPPAPTAAELENAELKRQLAELRAQQAGHAPQAPTVAAAPVAQSHGRARGAQQAATPAAAAP